MEYIVMKKRIFIIVAALLIIILNVYLNERNTSPKLPEGWLAISYEDTAVMIDPFSSDLSDITGVIITGKDEEKEITETGISLFDAIELAGISPDSYSKVRVVSEDDYSVELSAEEVATPQKVYLAKQREYDDSTSARLIVFGDNNSKRQVKKVALIDLQK
ncbi:hypothetical protein [Butyrivibrio sp. AC2005]|uniref:hypothetical protein n=1 Tax=Butyrivibrio sp. AC2005 TaxID=1280672 RepID=UPI000408F1C9|nr:hypothetical protein [Butyrivibrio sp. AC2005]